MGFIKCWLGIHDLDFQQSSPAGSGGLQTRIACRSCEKMWNLEGLRLEYIPGMRTVLTTAKDGHLSKKVLADFWLRNTHRMSR
ncbi:MAG: hypothetical protein ACM3MK_09660 [Chitinophagales bacterium]